MTARRNFLCGLTALPIGGGLAILATATASRDRALVGLADELDALDRQIKGVIAQQPDRDYPDEMPGAVEMERRRFEVLGQIASTPSVSLAGIRAKARALKTDDVDSGADMETVCNIASSLADDLLALPNGGGRA